MSTQVLIQSVSDKIGLIGFPKVRLRNILISGVILSISLLAFYIFQISIVTGAVSSTSEYERKISILSEQNKGLENALLRKSTVFNLEIAIKKLNFEKVSKVNYIQIMDSEMAVRR